MNANERIGADYFHVDIASPDRSATENNLSLEDLLYRIAVPLQLRRTVLVDGYEFQPNYLKRFKITPLRVVNEPGYVLSP